MYKLLAVNSPDTNYTPFYEVTFASSFGEAKERIQQAEQEGAPFYSLDLPVSEEEAFWEFIRWMVSTGRHYPVSIFGCASTFRFLRFRDELGALGIRLNT